MQDDLGCESCSPNPGALSPLNGSYIDFESAKGWGTINYASKP